MAILSSVRKFLLNFDFFSSFQLLRYNKEPEYRTLTGSILSIIIIGVFCILFMNMAIKTVQRSIISYTVDVGYTNQTETVSFNGMDPSNFMFALELYGIDLSGSERYFDLVMYQQTYNKETLLNSTEVPMERCTADHFNMTDKLKARYDQLGARRWLCPKKDYEFTLQGKYTSQISQIVYVSVAKCNNSTDPSRPCVNQSVVDDMFASDNVVVFSFYFVNALINPSSQEYLDYYLNDLNYAQFTKTLGVKSYGYVSQYDITTDMSILPWSENLEESGAIIDDVFQVQSEEVFDDTYVQFFIYKSGIMRSYQRTYNKLDNFFSYIGGLFGAIMTGMLVMKSFTQSAYELSIASRLYSSPSGGPLDIKSYNFLTHIVCKIYGWLTKLKIYPNWPQIKLYDDCMEEAIKQLDVRFLMQRITFMERALMVMFNDHQWKGLHMSTKLTLLQAEKIRKTYKMKRAPSPRKPGGDQGNNVSIVNQNQELKLYGEYDTIELRADRTIGLSPSNESLPHPDQISYNPLAIKVNPIMVNQINQKNQHVADDDSQQSQKPTENYFNKQNILKLKRESSVGNPISSKILQFVRSDLIEDFAEQQSPERQLYKSPRQQRQQSRQPSQRSPREQMDKHSNTLNIEKRNTQLKHNQSNMTRKQAIIQDMNNEVLSDDFASYPISNTFNGLQGRQ